MLALLVLVTGLTHFVSGAGATTHSGRLVSTQQNSTASLSGPLVPSGAYLGAWVFPDQTDHAAQSRNQLELTELGNFQDAIGHNLAIVHLYQPWSAPPTDRHPLSALASNATLHALSADGAIPMIDWQCGETPGNVVTDTQIVDGDEDKFITSYAEQLKAYGRPVFLRWFWEPNLVGGPAERYCMQDDQNAPPTQAAASEYVKAFQHIYDIFKGPHGVSATNVAFVWNPGLGGSVNPTVLEGLYPGSAYVDWIGADGYSRPPPQSPPNPSFSTLFGPIYSQLQTGFYGSPPKPILIGETGAIPSNQSAYLSSTASALTSGKFAKVHAFVYYDSSNPSLNSKGDWALSASGLTAFAQMAQNPVFSTPGT